MIGNSHIDIVWFWDWSEGMQEVKATLSSVLDRLNEDENFKFTATSTVFFEWIEEIAPDMFTEIKQRVKEGRIVINGGWYIEPDCILPCGEAFVRQGLYGQRYLKEKFGKMATVGSNVDSFGHNPTLPQILQKSGLNAYVFMRPRLKDTPVFFWESQDGSQVLAISLPSEYTTWFYDASKEAMNLAQKAAEKANLNSMPCCFGVGNHGGGPTKENIAAIYQLQKEMPDVELSFSSYDDFIQELSDEEKMNLPVQKDFFDHVNTGCYSMDGALKKINRMTEERLVTTDFMLFLEESITGKTTLQAKKMEELWKALLFNQFHDTLGGTAIKSARDEAIMQLTGVCATTKKIWTLAMQNIVNSVDTLGEGFPLFLFNPSGEDYNGPIEVELNWFCKDGLTLLNQKGEEIEYQRTYTQAKARNYNLGGRRALVFQASIPAGGFVIYRTVVRNPNLACDIRNAPEFPLANNYSYLKNDTPYTLENAYIKAEFNDSGYLAALIDKQTGCNALTNPISYPIWLDERDSWGSIQERRFMDSQEKLELFSLETVESGAVRKVVRATYKHEGSCLTQLFILYKEAKSLEVKNHLFWDKNWQMLLMDLPVSGTTTASDCAYGQVIRQITDTEEYSMHKFVDVLDEKEAGLLIVNDGKYTYRLFGNSERSLQLPLARSAIYAQGNGKNWYNPIEGYEYADIGGQDFIFHLYPHGQKLAREERQALAEILQHNYLYLADNLHSGESMKEFKLIQSNTPNIMITAVKQSEDNKARIIRLLETGNRDTKGSITVLGKEYNITIKAAEILTLKLDIKNNQLQITDMLENEVK